MDDLELKAPSVCSHLIELTKNTTFHSTLGHGGKASYKDPVNAIRFKCLCNVIYFITLQYKYAILFLDL